MVYNGIIEGKFTNLRSATENDAAFILEVRNNPEISKRIPPFPAASPGLKCRADSPPAPAPAQGEEYLNKITIKRLPIKR